MYFWGSVILCILYVRCCHRHDSRFEKYFSCVRRIFCFFCCLLLADGDGAGLLYQQRQDTKSKNKILLSQLQIGKSMLVFYFAYILLVSSSIFFYVAKCRISSSIHFQYFFFTFSSSFSFSFFFLLLLIKLDCGMHADFFMNI